MAKESRPKKSETKNLAKSNSMTDESAHKLPPGSQQTISWRGERGSSQKILATADWILLKKAEKPAAEIFYTYYRNADQKKSQASRPLFFIFNGGPGAASAYLHIGGLGPLRVRFSETGHIPPGPITLVDNKESWLEFADLVFVDPVGTGFSRVIKSEAKKDKEGKDSSAPRPEEAVDEKEFYQLNRDLDSLGEFIERFLSQYNLWHRAIYLAGESYGGFRTAKMARRLQEKSGVPLAGVVIISPALEWGMLNQSDYDVTRTVDTFCVMALAAAFHKRSRIFNKGGRQAIEKIREQIEGFATTELSHALLVGSAHNEKNLEKTYKKCADFLGLPVDLVQVSHGRIPFWRFCRDLLKEDRQILGFYDATITAFDPFPDREIHQAPDPTLTGEFRVFTSGINQLLRERLKISTDRRYELLSDHVNTSWKRDEQVHAFDLNPGATDDLRYAMSMNPHMKVLITHGIYDLVTPYFTSERLVDQMKLPKTLETKLEVKYFDGGHMFYTWDQSRRDFRNWVKSCCANN